MIWLFGFGLIAGGLAVWTVVSARRAEEAFPPTGEFVTVDGTRLHYLRRGSGPPLVLLHGSDGSLLDFADTVVDSLARDYEVFAFDRPGHGYSEGPYRAVATPQVQLRLLHEALCRLGVEKPVLVGHSWSGLLLMLYALEYPEEVAGLVLLAPWVYAPASPPSPLLYTPRIPLLGELSLWTLHRLVKGLVIRVTLRQAFSPAPVPPAYARQSEAIWLRWPRQVKVFARENTSDRPVLREASVRYGQVRVPTVIVAGDTDRIVPAQEHAVRLHRDVSNAELVLLLDTGHQLLHTCPEAVCESIRRCTERAQTETTTAAPGRDVVGLPAGAQTGAACSNSLQRVRELVFRYGWNATSYQILNPEMEYWFAAEDGVVGYVRRGGFRIVAGAPVCAKESLTSVVVAFEKDAAEAGEKVCYFGAASRLRTVLQSLPDHAEMIIGAQPAWNPQEWAGLLAKNASLRAQINRARNKGVGVEEWPGEQAAGDDRLQTCMREWLTTRPLPTLRFLTEPVNLTQMQDRRLFVAQSGESVVGFLIATPVPDRNGWLIEQIVRGRAAPNGMAELLVGTAMQMLAADGAEYVTLGLAPLSQRAGGDTEAETSWLHLLLNWVRAHGKRFYNFDGLDSFKAKFKPDTWEPLYAIVNERHFSLSALYAIAAAFSEGPPLAMMLRAIRDAARQELRWLRQRPSARSG